MTRFYICTTGIAKGPYMLSDIDRLEINSNDIVWTSEYRTGKKAIQIPEFKEYFRKKMANSATGYSAFKSRLPAAKHLITGVLLLVLGAMIVYYITQVA